MDRRHIRDGSQWIDGKKPLTHYSCRGGAEEERVEEDRAIRDRARIGEGGRGGPDEERATWDRAHRAEGHICHVEEAL